MSTPAINDAITVAQNVDPDSKDAVLNFLHSNWRDRISDAQQLYALLYDQAGAEKNGQGDTNAEAVLDVLSDAMKTPANYTLAITITKTADDGAEHMERPIRTPGAGFTRLAFATS